MTPSHLNLLPAPDDANDPPSIAQPSLPLAPQAAWIIASQSADAAAAARVFAAYRERKSHNTVRRHDADLDLFASYLEAAGLRCGDLATTPAAWEHVTWGLVQGFVVWMSDRGYAVGSINVRLSTVKAYAKLAVQAGAIAPTTYALIKTVAGYRHVEGRNLDRQRETTRVGAKKASAILISKAQALALKEQPDTPQGRRDALLLAILLDHGLRCSEVALLKIEDFDLRAGTFTFYRPKVHKTQTHKLMPDALRAAYSYLLADAPKSGPLLLGSHEDGTLGGTMGERAINARVGVLGERLSEDLRVVGLSPHDLRHYWATMAARAGTSVKALQDAGGWSSPAMPLRYVESAQIANHGVLLE